ncbi:MAG: VWA domain-containing protein [Huintestinicola sp.]|uniref:VWA domain-containing protein n=1 Tax=Huintestinicola sp. TaxID=2981661 RepID=UPI003EFF9AFE
MSNNKKKKKKAAPAPAAPETAAANAASENGEDEANIPVQSFSEMMAFSDDDMGDDEPAPKAEEKSAPKTEEKPAPKAEEKPAPKTEEKPAPKAENKQIMTAEETLSSGPMISEAEAARRARAEDALDRDLAAARKKKLQEEAYNKHQRDMEMQKEAERLSRAEQARQRQDNVQEMAKKRAELKAAQEAIAASEAKAAANSAAEAARRKHNANKRFNRAILSMKAGKAVLVIVILLILAYAGAFIYVGAKNDEFYTDLETKLNSRSQIVSNENDSYEVPEISPLTAEQKDDLGLYRFLADSDMDGLPDEYEIRESHTDPLNADCDGDGVLDGREVRAELDPNNPCTDGSTPDGEVIRDITVSERSVAAKITGIPNTAYTSLSKLANNSIQGTPGLVGYAYEFYTDKNFDSCTMTFSYSEKEIVEGGVTESALSVYRFDEDKLLFEKLASTLDAKGNTVSAEITESGVYAVCDASVLMQKGSTNIFFLIDNSGSMYPEELCANSEENDVEFKRLDFAVNLIDMLGNEANYGAGEFSGGYAQITPISNDSDAVKKQISDIRNKHQVFSGTEIAGAIKSAVAEFGSVRPSDKNYIILLTDGMPSNYDAAAEKQAVELAKSSGITVFTIGLGKKIDTEYLFNIAEDTNGQFFQASNADALENIYDKIQSFMSYNQVTIEEESGRKGYIVADSGFNVLKDGIGYSNFRSDFAPSGTDKGIAGLIRAYYTGELSLAEKGFTTIDGKTVEGYDISGVQSFTDSRTDLSNVKMDILDSYTEYLALPNKWDFRKIRNGVLGYSEETRDFIDSHMMKVITADFSFKAPESDSLTEFLRTITFNKLKGFDSYESVLIDSTMCQGDDLAVMNMLRWFDAYPRSGKCTVYDFGYQGDMALDELVNELTTGSPAVIVYGGTAMNAVRIVRDAKSPNLFVIDAYDCNSPERSTRISLLRTPIYDGSGVTSYQYSASRGSEPESLQIIVSE